MKLEKIAASGYDQDAEEKLAKEKKATAKAKHIAKQQAEHDAAWKRKVRARAELIRLEREANALLDELDKEYSLKKTTSKKILNESVKTAKEDSSWTSYRKPDKPFSKFTQAEKRDYWRYQNAKRRASKQG